MHRPKQLFRFVVGVRCFIRLSGYSQQVASGLQNVCKSKVIMHRLIQLFRFVVGVRCFIRLSG